MKQRSVLYYEGSIINQIICALLINIPVFGYGASIGWMSPMSLLLQSKDSPKGEKYSELEISLMAGVPYLVCVPADFLMAYLGDKVGRKYTLLFVSLASTAIWGIKLSSYNAWVMVAARALVGISMAGAYVTCPVYTKEIAQDSIRGILGSLIIFFHTFGNLFAYTIGAYLSYNTVLYISILIPLIHIVLFITMPESPSYLVKKGRNEIIFFHTFGNLFAYTIGAYLSYNTVLYISILIPLIHIVLFITMPESPSYLVKKGRNEEAKKVLAWLRCRCETDMAVQEELDVIRKEQQVDAESSKFVLKAIFKDKILSRAFRIAMITTISREVCGAILVMNFAGDIFAMASTEGEAFLGANHQAMLLGAVQVFGAMVASSFVEKCGRKPLLLGTSILSGLSMCGLASWFLTRQFGVYGVNWLPITTLCLAIFCDSAGLQPLSVVITGEIFSFKYRGTVLAAAMATSAALDFLQLIFFKPMVHYMGAYSMFYFCSAVCFINAVYVLVAVPETKFRKLEEIYDDLRTKKEKLLNSLNSDTITSCL